MSDWYFEGEEERAFVGHEPLPLDFDSDPAAAIANILAGGLMEVCGPLFWGMLIVGFFSALFSHN